ncbi:hypothetical protein T439DRAFT_141813 [Meredithblackwellia eburnea MCA 4105]
MELLTLAAVLVLLSQLIFTSLAAPVAAPTSPPSNTIAQMKRALARKDYQPGDVPYFPSDIQACTICEPQWSTISSCALAAPAFQKFSEILTDPATFISLIKCGCTDTFQSAYPQCVACFVQTNQCQQFLGVPSESGANSIVDGMRNVCGFGSALLGGGNVATGVNATYTYTGEPSQGYPTTTSYGPGGYDLGSGMGASAASAASRSLPSSTVLLIAVMF